MKGSKNLCFVLSGLFAAMIFVMTRFVQIPTGIGYVHLGDTLVYLAAAFLPTPYALGASVVGSALSDVTSGFAIYAPVTMIVKALLVLAFTNKRETLLNLRNIVAVFGCGLITIGGYFAFEIFYYGIGAYASMIPNLIQSGVSGVLFILIGAAFDKGSIKRNLQV